MPSGSMFGGNLSATDMDAVAQAAFDQSRSQAITGNLSFMVNGNLMTASLIPVSSQCTCTAANSVPQCLGGLMMDNFRFNGTFIPNPANPNTVFDIPAANGGGQIIFDQRIMTGTGNGRSLTVNGVHVIIPGVADVIISKAESGIFCGSNVAPEPVDEELKPFRILEGK